jgi:uncharacterized protein (DUF2384 family)
MTVLDDPMTVLRRLRENYGLTEDDVARATGASLSAVRRWNKAAADEQTARRASEYHDKIDDLRAVIQILSTAYPNPEFVRTWLRSRCRLLGYERPIDVLAAQDGFERVAEAAHAAAGGDYV